jgi:hypothetical protein
MGGDWTGGVLRSKADQRQIKGRSKADQRQIKGRSKADQRLPW